jgi:hypothetical protein
MRAVWSFWSKPFYAGRGHSWHRPLHHLLAWGLSLRLARRHYPETVLVTDHGGKALLVDQLGLSFTHVCLELDRIDSANSGWWALGKLIAYSLQDAPFLHLDADVFLWKPLPERVVNAPVFAQCPEHGHSADEWCGPLETENAFADHGLALPDEWVWSRARGGRFFREENCGIVGGRRVDFLRYYANLAVDLVLRPANAPAWERFLCSDKELYNMIVEQFLLAACVDFHRYHPESPFAGIDIRYLFPSFDDAFQPASAARAGFTHLLGHTKANAAVARRLEDRVRREDPAFYRHCMRLS